MAQVRETVATIIRAARYSLAFCIRNAQKESVIRILLACTQTLLLYLTIQATGLIVNDVERLMARASVPYQVPASLWLLLGTFVATIIHGRLNWFFKSRWSMKLRYANTQELNDHRSTLDVGRFKSKEYDDLEKRIQELPWSWQTRVWFSDELLNLLSTILSFALFGASLISHAPLYAVILVITAGPMMVTEFRQVAMWWDLFQELVPTHKKRAVMEKPYKTQHAFVQALMFGQMPHLKRIIKENIDDVHEAYDRIRWLSLKNEFVVHLIAVTGLCGVVIHAVWSTITSGGGIGTLTIVIAAARTFQGNLESIVSLVAEQWNSAKGVVLIEEDFFGMKPMISTPYPVMPPQDITPAIQFENVSFRYPEGSNDALTDVSFTIEPGSKVAIVGKSGNGKSTIQALLMRHYDPTKGSIFADSVNLRNIEPGTWNKIASALTQEYVVLERTVGEEIASSLMGQDINPSTLSAAARFAHFEEVVSADPRGYDSQIGVEFGGRDFSGGEKQRLALARVRYRNTPILILDEPDAKLDPESAQHVINQVFALEGVTLVMITHHVSRAERCDKVIVMHKGRVSEQGTPQELMARGGMYAALYAKDKERQEGLLG